MLIIKLTTGFLTMLIVSAASAGGQSHSSSTDYLDGLCKYNLIMGQLARQFICFLICVTGQMKTESEEEQTAASGQEANWKRVQFALAPWDTI